MSSIPGVYFFELWDCYSVRLLKDVNISLSGKDLQAYNNIKEIVNRFSQKLRLPQQSSVVLSNSVGWSNFYTYFTVPTKCFSKETRAKIYQVWEEKNPFPINNEFKQAIMKISSIERKIFKSMSIEEWSMLIGHELGHAWLHHHFKAFYSRSVKVEGKELLNLQHDRALERVCDFIGVYLTSPRAGITAMEKESKNPEVSDTDDDSHPPFKERIRYISEWVGDPRLQQELTEALVLDIGGPVFQEAVPIYRKYGK